MIGDLVEGLGVLIAVSFATSGVVALIAQSWKSQSFKLWFAGTLGLQLVWSFFAVPATLLLLFASAMQGSTPVWIEMVTSPLAVIAIIFGVAPAFALLRLAFAENLKPDAWLVDHRRRSADEAHEAVIPGFHTNPLRPTPLDPIWSLWWR